ncbi:hydroxyethylthiazole kinase-like uncharacterized protein yjeF [Sphingomonas trueperi]
MPEAAVFELPANGAGELGAAAGGQLVGLLGRCDTLILGPGTGKEADAGALLDAVLAAKEPPPTLLLDAATLGVAADRHQAIKTHVGRTVLTPHPGEMAGLMHEDPDRIARSPVDVVKAAARRFGAVVALKGADTHVATPEGMVLRYPGGGPGLATGGSGDVLAGIIGGLLARGVDPLVAASWGVWLHGEAGRRLADRIGPIGFLSRELPGEIPRLMAEA